MLAFYSFEPFISQVSVFARRHREAPNSVERTPPNNPSQVSPLCTHEVRERRTSLIGIRKCNFELAIVEDELFSPVVIPLEFHHESKFVTLADHPVFPSTLPLPRRGFGTRLCLEQRRRFRRGRTCADDRIQMASKYRSSHAESDVSLSEQRRG